MSADVRPVFGIDVDSTVWDACAWFCDSAKRLHNVDLKPEEIASWDYLKERFGTRGMVAVFDHALDPARCMDRVLFPGVKEAVAEIEEMGIQVMFFSHNHRPAKMIRPLTGWLRREFGEHIRVSVMRGDQPKVKALEAVDGFGLVDDAPQTVAEVADSGRLAICPAWPYNEAARGKEGVASFDPHEGWPSVPEIVGRWLYEDDEEGSAA